MRSIDVIVPCYRYGHFLRECVESVIGNTSLQARVLVIDDASPDNTVEVANELIQKFPQVTFRRHELNKGHIATYNEGIEWLAADYMLLLSADDYMLPGALDRAVDLMEANPKMAFCYGKAIITGESGITSQPPSGGIGDEEPESRILESADFFELTRQNGSVNVVPTPTAVVRTGLLQRLGGYRADLPHTGDMEMWLRLAAHGSVGEFVLYQAVWRRHRENMQLQYYDSKGRLPDLEQRKAAIDCFYHACRNILPDAQQLYQSLLIPLANEGVALASSAFNKGELEISKQLSAFGLGVDPEVRSSSRWKVLSCKRAIGYRLWSGLQPAVAWFRKRPDSF